MANAPLLLRMPEAMQAMEAASNDLWRALRGLSVQQLQALRPTPEYVPLIDALIAVRLMMDASIERRDFVPRPHQQRPW